MVRCSNSLIGILNIVKLVLSIPIIWAGAWLNNQGSSDCDKFLVKPVIILGVFLLLVSLAGLIGSCCRVTWLLWLYLVVMFILIVVLFAFTIFTFVVTNKGAGEVLSNRGYKEYRLGDYSDWLRDRVTNNKNWNKIKSCLVESKVCSSFNEQYLRDSVAKLYSEHLSAVQAGCCKPSDDCNFTYKSPTNWEKPTTAGNFTNPDCNLWDNDPNVLCFNCDSCKAGLLHNLKTDWKKVAIVNIVFLVFLIIVYSIGCCAFRNNREYNAYPWKRYP